MTESATIAAALAAPLPVDQVEWKAQTVKGARALAVAYIDARTVMDRLDLAAGIDGWQDEYELLPEGSVLCRLRLKIAGEWVTKADVGSPSEQPDAGDRAKAAISDALKRAAVKFGVGRYLYSLPKVWVDYDAQKKQLAQLPALPAWAVPAGGPPPYEKHAGAITGAPDLDALKAAFAAAYQDKRLTDAEQKKLTKLKDGRKAILQGQKPAPAGAGAGRQREPGEEG